MDEGEVDTDAALLVAARQGDDAALVELKARHTPVARRLALSYARPGVSADDIVAAAFTQLTNPSDRGVGAKESFRAYLFVKVRRAATSAARQRSEPVPQGLIDLTIDAPDVAPPGNAREFISRSFDELSERHQVALWHATVEGAGPAELGRRLHLSADSAAAVTYRAREELRSGYLRARLDAAPQPACSPHAERLDAFVRRSLKHRDRIETAAHLEVCADCREIVDELSDVSVLLLRATVPLLLGFSLLTGLPPVEAPPFRAIRAQRAARVALTARGLGSARRRSAVTVIAATVLLMALAATAFAISSQNSATDRVSAGTVPSPASSSAPLTSSTSTPRRHATSTTARHRVMGALVTSTTRPKRHHGSSTTTTSASHGGGSGGGPTSAPGHVTTTTAGTGTPRTTTTTAHPTTTVAPTTTDAPTTTTTTEPTTEIP